MPWIRETTAMDERERRVVLNEAVFRQANEALVWFQDSETALDLMCECGRADCVAKIEMSRSEYERLRADPTLFAVVRGHEIAGFERVVEAREGYDVVQKHLETHDLAEETDPRSD
jgi:hypothetical protein